MKANWNISNHFKLFRNSFHHDHPIIRSINFSRKIKSLQVYFCGKQKFIRFYIIINLKCISLYSCIRILLHLCTKLWATPINCFGIIIFRKIVCRLQLKFSIQPLQIFPKFWTLVFYIFPHDWSHCGSISPFFKKGTLCTRKFIYISIKPWTLHYSQRVKILGRKRVVFKSTRKMRW